MDADNLKEIGHKGFTVDAQAMTAVLFDFATHADYRDGGEEGVRRDQGAVRRVSGGAEEDLHGPERAGSEVDDRRPARLAAAIEHLATSSRTESVSRSRRVRARRRC